MVLLLFVEVGDDSFELMAAPCQHVQDGGLLARIRRASGNFSTTKTSDTFPRSDPSPCLLLRSATACCSGRQRRRIPAGAHDRPHNRGSARMSCLWRGTDAASGKRALRRMTS